MAILDEALEGRAKIIPWTVDQYHAGIASGWIPEDVATELLDGFIVHKDRASAGEDVMKIGDRHRTVVVRLTMFSGEALKHHCFIQSQQPISFPPNNEPEPDISVVRGHPNDYEEHPPTATDVCSVIEVSDSSLKRDMGTKLRLYALSAIPQYIVVDLLADRVMVFETPKPDGNYASSKTLTSGMRLDIRVAIASFQSTLRTYWLDQMRAFNVFTGEKKPARAFEAARVFDASLALASPLIEPRGALLRLLWKLAWPVLAEHVLHMLVGLNDTYLANHVDVAGPPANAAAAAAAVGTISYILWLIGLLTGAVSTGSTALISRATGARHRRLANSVCGQSIAAAIVAGLVLFLLAYLFSSRIVELAGLTGNGFAYANSYLKLLSLALPFITVMFVANACLRGAGNTLTPAITFIVVDIVNIVFSWGWTYGLFSLPRLGFDGIALGTVVAYIAGGVIQLIVLLRGRRFLRLHLHRLRPSWHQLKRILRIGLPSGLSDLIQWLVNFAMIAIINRMDTSLVSSAAHNNTVKIEGISYLGGFAVATAAATMVGQSLGMKQPERARRCGYLGYALGGGIMTVMGLLFIVAGKYPAMLMSPDAAVQALTTRCLFITGFCQAGFAAAMVFGGALRGAGDTIAVMTLSLTSILCIRLVGVIIIARVMHLGLAAVWTLLACELVIRGCLIFGRFLQGGWAKVRV